MVGDKLKESVKKIEAPDFENIDELFQNAINEYRGTCLWKGERID